MTPHKAERVSRRNFRTDDETNLKRSFVRFLHGESPENWPDAWYSHRPREMESTILSALFRPTGTSVCANGSTSMNFMTWNRIRTRW